jgi:hypothetical protein
MDIPLRIYFQQADYIPEPISTQLLTVRATTHHMRQTSRNRRQWPFQKTSPRQIVDLSHHYSRRPMVGQTNCENRNDTSHNHQEAVIGALSDRKLITNDQLFVS